MLFYLGRRVRVTVRFAPLPLRVVVRLRVAIVSPDELVTLWLALELLRPSRDRVPVTPYELPPRPVAVPEKVDPLSVRVRSPVGERLLPFGPVWVTFTLEPVSVRCRVAVLLRVLPLLRFVALRLRVAVPVSALVVVVLVALALGPSNVRVRV